MLKPKFLGLLIIVLISLSSCLEEYRGNEAVKGVLDLREMDLDNQFCFLSGQWILDSYNKGFRDYYQVSTSGKKQNGLPEYGTLEMKVILPEDSEQISLMIEETQLAYAIYINNSLIGQAGTLGETKETSKPGKAVPLQPYAASDSSVIISFSYSNFHHRDNFFPLIYFSSQKNISQKDNINLFRDIFFAGTFFAFGLLYIMLFFYKKDAISALWFGLICLAIMIRLTLIKSAILERITPDSLSTFLMRIEYLTMTLSVIFFYLFSVTLFHNHRIYKHQWFILFPSFIYRDLLQHQPSIFQLPSTLLPSHHSNDCHCLFI